MGELLRVAGHSTAPTNTTSTGTNTRPSAAVAAAIQGEEPTAISGSIPYFRAWRRKLKASGAWRELAPELFCSGMQGALSSETRQANEILKIFGGSGKQQASSAGFWAEVELTERSSARSPMLNTSAVGAGIARKPYGHGALWTESMRKTRRGWTL